jgi:nucleotide-binding universal stress UspA family protein
VSALLQEGDSASALVSGSRGRGELTGLLLGSVSMAVAARAHCPVIVVRGDRAGLAGTHGRVLLGAGDPAVCGEAARFAVREAEARACELYTVRAWRRPTHETTARPPAAGELTAHSQEEEEASALLDALLREPLAAQPGVRSRGATVEGSARKVLLHRSAAADLLVIGVRHRHRHFGLQLGRVAHTLLHHADCPVAIVPQTD